MSDWVLPPLAYEAVGEVDGRPVFRAVEAPACGDRLVIAERGVSLSCDRPRGHDDGGRHRAVLSLVLGRTVEWCGERCVFPCAFVEYQLSQLRRTP